MTDARLTEEVIHLVCDSAARNINLWVSNEVRTLHQTQVETVREAALAQLRSTEVERWHGIYVASRVRHAEMWKRQRENGTPIISSWIDEAGDGDTDDFGELWDRIEGEIRRSSALVFYAEEGDDPWKGAFVEIGMAIAFQKPVFVVLNNLELLGRAMRPIGSWIKANKVTRLDTLALAFFRASRPARTVERSFPERLRDKGYQDVPERVRLGQAERRKAGEIPQSITWLCNAHGGHGLTKDCKKCNPDVPTTERRLRQQAVWMAPVHLGLGGERQASSADRRKPESAYPRTRCDECQGTNGGHFRQCSKYTMAEAWDAAKPEFCKADTLCSYPNCPCKPESAAQEKK